MSGKEIIDLRSDTVTKPTEEMLEAIRHAELGDDVFEEDPTVNRLERIAAEKMGKEAALFVTSGTQANLISLMTNANRGDLVIHFPKPSLLCLENTHNRHGGTIITPSQIKAISSVAHKNNLKLYLDGARIFNAAVALNVNVKEFTKHIDNLMFCLSKGLCCPVGSLLVGNQEFIERARKLRKILGGGMRQAGIIAAPGIVALESMIERLKEDHLNARYLAEGISKIDGIHVNLSRVQTNMVYFSIEELALTADQFISKLKENDILALALSENKIRMVTHKGIEKEHVEKSITTIKTISQ
jgi:threonine aldolase